MADPKMQRKLLHEHSRAVRAMELHEVAINALEAAGTTEGQRAIAILKRAQQRQVKLLDAAAAKLGAPYPTPGVPGAVKGDANG